MFNSSYLTSATDKMKELRYTLLSDGSSDQVLIPILTWLLRQHNVRCAIQAQWADLRRLPVAPKGLTERIGFSLDLYPCDLLFVHRDSEKEPHSVRVTEIQHALAQLTLPRTIPAICVVPVRMQEAWLLFEEEALRSAAGNPNGQELLQFPTITELEQLPDPKSILYALLRQASGLSGRRLKKFVVANAARRVAEFIDDFAPLRSLSAFQALETEVEIIVKRQAWSFD